MRQPTLADIATLMLKSHFELSRISEAFNSFSIGEPGSKTARIFGPVTEQTKSLVLSQLRGRMLPFDFSVGAGEGVRFTCAVQSDGLMTLTAEQKGRTYLATLPNKGAAEALYATIELDDGVSKQSRTLSGEELLEGKWVPEDFRALHEKIVEYAKRYLGGLRATKKDTQEPSKTSEPAGVQSAGDDKQSPEGFKQYLVRRTGEKDLRFTGRCIAAVSSRDLKGRHWQYSLFETQGGRFVGIKAGVSYWLGESDKVETVVADSAAETQQFFGSTPLAKALYEQANIDHFESIE